MLEITDIPAVRHAFGPGGVSHRSQLDARGLSGSRLRRHVAEGSIIPVIRGWYALPDAEPSLIRAIELGGRLTCVSALPTLGVWTPPTSELHLDFGAHSSGRRLHGASPDETIVRHWSARTDWLARPTAARDRVTVLRHVVLCQPAHLAVAILDSAVRAGMIAPVDIRRMVQDLPTRCARVLAAVDARAESGLESIARFELRRAGYRVEPQAVVGGRRYRVDLLVDGWLAIELDGREHHSGEPAFLADRRRDSALLADGILTLRFSWSQVLFEWDSVATAIEHAYRGSLR